MYEEIFHYLHGDILEVGSGLGIFSEKIINDFPQSSIHLTEISQTYISNLKKKFSNKNVTVSKLDLNSSEDYTKIGYGKFDSIFALNVFEHVERDEFALKQMYDMLKDGGNLIILVPCHKFLYNVIDKKVGHFRRYTKKELESKIKNTDFKIIKIRYFNMLGILGWYLNGNILKNEIISDSATKIFEKIIPIEKHLEKILHNPTGLSLICYLKK